MPSWGLVGFFNKITRTNYNTLVYAQFNKFRGNDHRKYLAPDEDDDWNAMAEVSRAYLVHFSDWPLPKPWKQYSSADWESARPECPEDEEEEPDRLRCANRVMWEGFYGDFKTDKDRICTPLM